MNYSKFTVNIRYTVLFSSENKKKSIVFLLFVTFLDLIANLLVVYAPGNIESIHILIGTLCRSRLYFILIYSYYVLQLFIAAKHTVNLFTVCLNPLILLACINGLLFKLVHPQIHFFVSRKLSVN